MKKSFSKKTQFLLILLLGIFLVIPSNVSANEYCRMIDEDDLIGLSDTILGCVDIQVLKASYPEYKDMTSVKTCNTYIKNLYALCPSVLHETFGCDKQNKELKKMLNVTNIDKHECVVYNDKSSCEKSVADAVKCGLTKEDIEAKIDAVMGETNFKTPSPTIRIPGLKLTDVKSTFDEDGNLNIPWIGQYISALYNFALVAFSILAVILIIIESIRIMVSGGGEEKKQGFKRVSQVMTGLVLAWLSYAVLYTINPDLVKFKTLKIRLIETVNLSDLIEETQTEIDAIGAVDTSALEGLKKPKRVCSTIAECEKICKIHPSQWPTHTEGMANPKTETGTIPGIRGIMPNNKKIRPPLIEGLKKVSEAFTKTSYYQKGYKIMITSGYRDLKTQLTNVCNRINSPLKKTNPTAYKKLLQGIGPMVAWPGGSPHGNGIAIDVRFYDKNKLYNYYSDNQLKAKGKTKNKRTHLIMGHIMWNNDNLTNDLEAIMRAGGFYRYCKEWWHFEMGTAGSSWRPKSGQWCPRPFSQKQMVMP